MGRIDGSTSLLAVIGHPIAHSLSPAIQNAFAAALNLSYAYLAFDITPEKLPAFFAAMRTLPIAGCNVTMPLKEAALSHMDTLGDSARRHRAVNTVVCRDGQLTGYNTDGDGFLRALAELDFVPKPGERAVILGTGGAAKAVATALDGAGMTVRQISLTGRGEVSATEATLGAHLADCALLVNATPLGMAETPADFTDLRFLAALPAAAVVADLIYTPRRTRLLAAAAGRGLRVMNGLPHLVHQAALSFALFTGHTPSFPSSAALLAQMGVAV